MFPSTHEWSHCAHRGEEGAGEGESTVACDRSIPKWRQDGQAILTEGIESLPPGRTLVWALGPAFDLMNKQEIPQSYKFTVTADGPFGRLPALTYIVDMSNWRQSQDRPAGNLFYLTRAVEKLTKEIAERSE
jgi:hypothetical protein